MGNQFGPVCAYREDRTNRFSLEKKPPSECEADRLGRVRSARRAGARDRSTVAQQAGAIMTTKIQRSQRCPGRRNVRTNGNGKTKAGRGPVRAARMLGRAGLARMVPPGRSGARTTRPRDSASRRRHEARSKFGVGRSQAVPSPRADAIRVVHEPQMRGA